jgi:hypothetical protein
VALAISSTSMLSSPKRCMVAASLVLAVSAPLSGPSGAASAFWRHCSSWKNGNARLAGEEFHALASKQTQDDLAFACDAPSLPWQKGGRPSALPWPESCSCLASRPMWSPPGLWIARTDPCPLATHRPISGRGSSFRVILHVIVPSLLG